MWGAVLGALATLVLRGQDHAGRTLIIALTVVGALIGGFIGAEAFGVHWAHLVNLPSWAVATLGAVVTLLVVEGITHRRRRRSGRSRP